MGNKLGYPEVDLTGKVAIVTGGNTGIGYETAKGLARLGAHTFIACRSKERAEAALERMKTELGCAPPTGTSPQEEATTEPPSGGGGEEESGEGAKGDTPSQEASGGGEEQAAKGDGEASGEGEQVKSKEESDQKIEVKVEFLPLDLSSLQSTTDFVRAFKEKDLPLHILINNAALCANPYTKTDDGFESQFQVNHLSHMLLTLELLPVLLDTAAQSGDVRIINVSSYAHLWAQPFDPTRLNRTEEQYTRASGYNNSKLYNVMTAIALQRKLQQKNITVSSLHPGYMGDRDEALHYLLNKLKSEDGWSGSNLAWNEDKLSIIADQFSSFDGVAKVKVLLSFIGMAPRTISQCSNEMLQILRLARRDGDEWVRLFASVLAPFPNNQSISVDQITEEGGLEGIQEEISDALSQHTHHLFTPHEYAYLNHPVLQDSHNFTVPSGHSHFVLKSQPQSSVQLRSEMLQRAGTDFSQTGSLIKDRHLLQRQMSTSSGSGSNPFVSTSRSTSSRKSVPIPGLSNRINRERGTKLLDIDEVPVTNKRKRKPIPDEITIPANRPEGKKHPRIPSKGEAPPDTPTPVSTPAAATPSYVATPDYATGLGLEYEPMSPAAYGIKSPEFEGQAAPPLNVSPKKEPIVPPVIPPLTPTFTPGIDKPAELPLFGRPQGVPPATPTTPLPTPSPAPGDQPPQPANTAIKQPGKGLKLSRQQLAIAQEMFKESPSLTREQKALILGFMAGSRENPNPSQPVMTIKLNSKHDTEEVSFPSKDGSSVVKGKRNVLIETVFEMNYSNGQWRKLQLKRTFPMASAR